MKKPEDQRIKIEIAKDGLNQDEWKDLKPREYSKEQFFYKERKYGYSDSDNTILNQRFQYRDNSYLRIIVGTIFSGLTGLNVGFQNHFKLSFSEKYLTLNILRIYGLQFVSGLSYFGINELLQFFGQKTYFLIHSISSFLISQVLTNLQLKYTSMNIRTAFKNSWYIAGYYLTVGLIMEHLIDQNRSKILNKNIDSTFIGQQKRKINQIDNSFKISENYSKLFE